MSKKSSVYFGPPLEALTSSLSDEDSVSGRLNRTAERYLEIVKRHDLKLTKLEQSLVRQCLSGSSWVDPLLIRHLADVMNDSEHAHSNVGKTLIKKLQAATYADLVAEVERLGF